LLATLVLRTFAKLFALATLVALVEDPHSKKYYT
jgi:hypothetical protein